MKVGVSKLVAELNRLISLRDDLFIEMLNSDAHAFNILSMSS